MSTLAAFYNQLSTSDAALLEKQAQALFQEQEEDAAARLMARGFADELSKLAQDKDPWAVPRAPATAAPAQQRRITRAPSTDYRPPTQRHVTQPKQLMESPRAGPVTPTYRPRPSPTYTPQPEPKPELVKKKRRRKKLVPKKAPPGPKPFQPGGEYLRGHWTSEAFREGPSEAEVARRKKVEEWRKRREDKARRERETAYKRGEPKRRREYKGRVQERQVKLKL